MATADDAGPVAQRVDLPTDAGRTIAAVFLFLLVLGFAVFWLSAGTVRAVYSVFAGPVVIGAGVTFAILKRKPNVLEVREKGLVLYYGGRTEFVEWARVRGIEQVILGMEPTHVVLFHGRKRLVLGTGDPAIVFAQEIVRRAGLRWLHEPFSAAR